MNKSEIIKELILGCGKSYKEVEERIAEGIINNGKVFVSHFIGDSGSLEVEIVNIDQEVMKKDEVCEYWLDDYPDDLNLQEKQKKQRKIAQWKEEKNNYRRK